jgi:3-hydroxyisobutyrate dehydrogenase-like beta-hydroxyacid dehydrogenase
MNIALIGYGEVGRIFAEDLKKRGHALSAFDVKLGHPHGESLSKHAEQTGVRLTSSAAEAVEGARLIICAVTASQTLVAAKSCLAGLVAQMRACYLDFNSASPGAKTRASDLMQQAGALYVEAAVMTSVPPYRSQVPMLLGGPHARALLPELEALGFRAKIASDKLGIASATKMCRSVMIKGLEAMIIESFTTARAYGVEDQVIASLHETFPGIDWEAQGSYFFQRAIEHGQRRSEEMFESAATVQEAGLEPLSAKGTAERQAWVAQLSAAGVFGHRAAPGFARSADWRVEADRILDSIKP